MVNIALRIRKLREAKGFSQDYMAKQLGITQSAYCKLESNNRKINFENINKITSALGVDIVEIVQTKH